MSLGYGGLAILAEVDETMLIYTYSCYNLDIHENEYQRIMELQDGEIYINKDTLVEPIIKEKIKRMPSGRKKLLKKKIIQYVDVVDLYEAGKIIIKNASGTWLTVECGMDFVARSLCSKVFTEYQETGMIPKRICAIW